MEEHNPLFVNALDKCVFWTWREVYVFVGTAGFAFLIAPLSLLLAPVVAMGCGAIGVRLFKKLDDRGFTTGGLYWVTPDSSKRFSSFPLSYVRRWLG